MVEASALSCLHDAACNLYFAMASEFECEVRHFMLLACDQLDGAVDRLKAIRELER